jgi:hypothetical protein
VAVVATPAYLDKYYNRVSSTGSIVAAEMDLILQRLTSTEATKETVVPILLHGEPKEAMPPLLVGRVCSDFRRLEDHFMVLFDLVLTLHGIGVADPSVGDLRERLRPRF